MPSLAPITNLWYAVIRTGRVAAWTVNATVLFNTKYPGLPAGGGKSMPKSKPLTFGLMDIPMSCSMFMEPALKRFKRYIAPVSPTITEYVHEWNCALLDVMSTSDAKRYLGQMGQKVIKGTLRSSEFASRCVEWADDVPMQSLHYAIRFSESVKFLAERATKPEFSFVDFGAGLSPLTAAFQTAYNLDDAYYIDIPEIMDVYDRVARLVGGRVPNPITWEQSRDLATSHKLDAIVAMGVFHYIDIDEQIKRMRFINKNYPYYLIEVKYNHNPDAAGPNTFESRRWNRLKMDDADVQTIETTLIKNSLRYLRNFISAMPGKRYFLENDRSVFLSR